MSVPYPACARSGSLSRLRSTAALQRSSFFQTSLRSVGRPRCIFVSLGLVTRPSHLSCVLFVSSMQAFPRTGVFQGRGGHDRDVQRSMSDLLLHAARHATVRGGKLNLPSMSNSKPWTEVDVQLDQWTMWFETNPSPDSRPLTTLDRSTWGPPSERGTVPVEGTPVACPDPISGWVDLGPSDRKCEGKGDCDPTTHTTRPRQQVQAESDTPKKHTTSTSESGGWGSLGSDT
eukprot:scaffold270_cov347-Pavlova_lutheri.AAC.33